MAEQLDEHTFTGAHPTARQFLDQLLAWRYTRCPDNGVHAVLKAPAEGKSGCCVQSPGEPTPPRSRRQPATSASRGVRSIRTGSGALLARRTGLAAVLWIVAR